MFKPTDMRKPTDVAKPLKPTELAEKAQAQMERLTKQLERQGIDREHASAIAEKVNALAEGPVAHDDWMTLEADRFSPATKAALDQKGLTPEVVLSDPDQAEAYAGQVFAREGIPTGNGGTEKVRGVIAGHYDETGHGIDLVAADAEGVPMPIEVKKYNQPSAAHLEDRPVVKLEPEVENWCARREAQVAGDHRLPVRQMDDLWTRDRWLKLIQMPEGPARLRRAGVDEKYLGHQRLRSSPDLPEWQAILDRRMAVIVSGREGDTGKRLFHQAVAEGRAKRVVKIEV